MADSLENINQKLDELLLEFFEKVEELQSTRNALASDMKNGFLLMSKARYSMGNKSVSSLQYSEKMDARVKVITKDDFLTKSPEEKEEVKGKNSKAFQIVSEGDSTSAEKLETDSNPECSVRRRRVVLTDKNKKDFVNSSELDEEEHVSKKTVKKFNDPLRWFGVLVPSCLRQCQQEFKSSCQFLCQIACLQFEINQILGDIKQLKELKSSFKCYNM